MVIEYIRYQVPPPRHREFESGWSHAQAALMQSAECLGYEVAHGVEEPDNYVVRIQWSSLEGHEQGFRASAGFESFFAAVKPFFEHIEEMRHYELTAITSAPTHGDARGLTAG